MAKSFLFLIYILAKLRYSNMSGIVSLVLAEKSTCLRASLFLLFVCKKSDVGVIEFGYAIGDIFVTFNKCDNNAPDVYVN